MFGCLFIQVSQSERKSVSQTRKRSCPRTSLRTEHGFLEKAKSTTRFSKPKPHYLNLHMCPICHFFPSILQKFLIRALLAVFLSGFEKVWIFHLCSALLDSSMRKLNLSTLKKSQNVNVWTTQEKSSLLPLP